jgi:assimilatory nitrate reductase catalytic subunit
MNAIRTTCPYCGVGCGVRAEAIKRGATIEGDKTHPANEGRLCSKGSALGETLDLETRLLHPMIAGQRANWNEALDLVAQRFSQTIAEYGPDSVAFYISGQLLTEDYYVANKLMKGFIGSANIDTNSRLCMSSAVAGHKRAFGADAVPGCYEDLELADLVVLVGSNTAWCHPVLYQRLMAARAAHGTKNIVIDPRRTPACDEADLHIALQPGTDVRLFNALLAQMAMRGVLDVDFMREHTVQFDQALAAARRHDPAPAAVAADCGVDPSVVETFFDWFAATPRTVTAFSQGVNQSSHGVDKVNAIINCHLATGRIGKPGMGPFSLTGQPNAMGGREVGGLANQLAAHMEFSNEADLAHLSAFWKTKNLARQPGLMAVDMFRAVEQKRIRALWIMATNPAVSLPDVTQVRSALEHCNFVVVSDCVNRTDTLTFADVALPAAGWSEKDGTVTNSERCISRQRPFLPAAGEARPDWWIITEVARRMGFGDAFPYAKPADIFREHAALSGYENHQRRAFDISGFAVISDAEYEAFEPVQWPVAEKHMSGTPRLFEDGRFFTSDGRARFIAVLPHGPAYALSEDFPLALNTGRIRDQWHTMTRTGLSPRLTNHRPEPFVEVHPDDAASFGVSNGGLARVVTAWGSGFYRTAVTDAQKRGAIFIPIHWTDQATAASVAGRLVNPVTDAISGQPEFKHTPATLLPVNVQWRGFFITRQDIAPPKLDYWTRIPMPGGFLYEILGIDAQAVMPTLAMLAGRAAEGGETVEIINMRRKDYRVARLEDEKLTHCLIVTRSGNLPPRDWLAGLLTQDRISADDRATLLAGRAIAPAPDDGALVCACYRVGRKRIECAIREGCDSVEAVGQTLQAGTNCGSCRPEIRALIRDMLEAVAA